MDQNGPLRAKKKQNYPSIFVSRMLKSGSEFDRDGRLNHFGPLWFSGSAAATPYSCDCDSNYRPPKNRQRFPPVKDCEVGVLLTLQKHRMN